MVKRMNLCFIINKFITKIVAVKGFFRFIARKINDSKIGIL